MNLLPRHVRAELMTVIASILSHQPEVESKSRIKRLMGDFNPPPYRLRVGEYRVFYIVDGSDVIIRHACHKDKTQEYYDSLSQNPNE